MPNAAILTVGSELVRGDGLDTNSQWLSRELEALGQAVRLHLSCLDDEADITKLMGVAADHAEVVIVTGGLGPTLDDRTRASAAAALSVPLELNEGELRHIEALFASFGRTMSPSNRRQAEIPRGARVLRNEAGTAPGFTFELQGAQVFVLPGVPREMRWMWRHHVQPALTAGVPPRCERTFRTVGIGESSLAEGLAEVEAREGVEVRYSAEEAEGTVRVTLLADDEARVQAAWEAAREVAGEHLACTGSEKLPERVVAELVASGWSLTTAESCTGGRVASRLTRVPSASRVFERGLVTYSNEAKHELLGVPRELLEAHGAVSEPVARAMALGARARGGTALGLGITGIAGPGGGSPDKPRGTVHMAVAGPGEDQVRHLLRRYPGDRERVQLRATAGALKLVLDACRAARAGGSA